MNPILQQALTEMHTQTALWERCRPSMEPVWAEVWSTLQGVPSLAHAYRDFPFSIFIPLSPQSHDELVIQLAITGRIAAVFCYGTIPPDVVYTVTTILQDQNFIILTDVERHALEQSGDWTLLF